MPLGERPAGQRPYLWLDATYVKVRQNGRVVSVAVIVAVGVNSDGRREVLGPVSFADIPPGIGQSPMDIGHSEAEAFWTGFLRKLRQRGLRGVRLVISDAHEGLKAAVAKLLHASWQRCRVHFARNALANAGRNGRRVVAAFIATGAPSPPQAGLGWATAFAHRCQRHRSGPAGTAASRPPRGRRRAAKASGALAGPGARRPGPDRRSTALGRCPSSPP